MYATHAGHPRDEARRFRIAARHSRRVRMLRILIPVLVVLAFVIVIVASVFNPWRMLTNLPIEMGNLVVSGTKITMESPRMAGYTPDGRAYEVSARAAAQDVTNPTQVELQDLQARIEMQDKSQLNMSASKGAFNTKGEILKLENNILLQSSNYEGRLQEALIDMKAGTVKSQKPVAVKFLQGTLDSQALSISQNGDIVRFEGGVTMNVMLNPAPPQAASQ